VPAAVSEPEVRAQLSPFGTLIWLSSVGPGCVLARFHQPDAAAAAARGLDGSAWLGNELRAQLCESGAMPAAPGGMIGEG
jgi:hypothetical protein